MKYKHGELQDKLIEEMHKVIDNYRVEVGDGLTFVDVYGCLEVVKHDLQKEADMLEL